MNKDKINIPDTWKWTTIGDISITSSGGTPDRKNIGYFNGVIPWVKSGELNYNTIYKTEEYISQEALDFSSAKLFLKGSLLIALYGNTVGRMAFLGVDAATNQAVATINSFLIDQKYLYYYLMHSKEALLEKREGSAQPNISQKILLSFPIPIAPIEEQKRIVEKIEELISELDNSIKYFELTVKIFKQNFKKTLNNLLKEVKGKEFSLSQVADWGSGGTPSRKEPQYFEGKIPWVKTQELKNKYISKTEEFLSEEGLKKSSAKVFPKGSLVIAMYGATVGRLSILNIDACTNQACGVAVVKKDLIDNEFLYFFLLNEKRKLIAKAQGGAQQNISLTILKNYKINLPQISVQKEIVNKIELLNSETLRQIKNIETEKKKVYALKQKILQHSFQGILSKQFETDSSVLELMDEIVKAKNQFIKQSIEISKKRPKVEKIELNLLEVLKENYSGSSFSYLEVHNVIYTTNDILEKEFDTLLKEKIVEKFFDDKSKSIKFRLR